MRPKIDKIWGLSNRHLQRVASQQNCRCRAASATAQNSKRVLRANAQWSTRPLSTMAGVLFDFLRFWHRTMIMFGMLGKGSAV